MQAATFHEHGPPSNIAVEAWPDPEIGPEDVLIRVRAASLNGFDPQIIGKMTELKTPLPMIPLGDFAGEVVACGDAVGQVGSMVPGMFRTGFEGRRWQAGDRVTAFPFVQGEGMTGETRLGTAAELIRMPARNLIPVPDEVSFETAACLPIAYGTAYHMLNRRARVRPGERVVVLGASGGVGVAVVQLAKLMGAEVIACARDDWKLGRLGDVGADHVIDTGTQDLVDAVQAIAGKPSVFDPRPGVDVVINYVGGESWRSATRVVKRHGRMVTCGASAGYLAETDLRYLWSYEQSHVGANGWFPADQVRLLLMVAGGALRPVIHDVLPLERTGMAIQTLADRKIFGKLVIAP